MARKENIDRILRDWPYDPQGISVRKKKGDDGRDVLQMRLDLGLLQLEATGRPDGTRPQGAETYFDYLVGRAVQNGAVRKETAQAGAEQGGAEPSETELSETEQNGQYTMSEEECEEADREFVQFYHRRICWLALRDFHNAVADADHTLHMMDFCRDHSPDEQWTLSHEQYRPFVLFHRTQAAALAALGDRGAEAAVEEINQGLDKMKSVITEYEAGEEFDEDELVQRLIELRESLRQRFRVGPTLQEQLADAVANEKYELAAEIRDELNRRNTRAR